MAIVRFDSYLDVYRHRAGGADPHVLSGRPGREYLTRFISRRILEILCTRRKDILVDIGCGDGELLRQAAEGIGQGWGVLPSPEEVRRVAAGFAGGPVRIRQGLADASGLSDNRADLLFSNGVFILLARDQVDAALAELARVGKPGALVFIGEVPIRDELAGRGYPWRFHFPLAVMGAARAPRAGLLCCQPEADLARVVR